MFHKILFSLLVSLQVSSCSSGVEVTNFIDRFFFSVFADTLFEKPKITGFREIHLSDDVYINGFVRVEGVVAEKGDFGTYIILSHNDDRLIVATTDLTVSDQVDLSLGVAVSVLGNVEVGKKGMPFLRAQSLKLN